MLNVLLTAVLGLIWLYLLHVLKKAGLFSWRFLVGAMGLFIFVMVWIAPVITDPLARIVAAAAGVFGQLTGWFTPYFRYGIIFINSHGDMLSLLIDMECSGIIEISAFLCLITFFDVYKRSEKIAVGIFGFLWIMFANALRIVLIAAIVHFFGTSSYYIAHTFIGRIFFYILSIVLYFYVFTKPQIVRMKVGNIIYGHNKQGA